MKTADFGLGTRFDDGKQTSVAVNRDNVVLEVHKSENEDTLWCHVGSIGRMAITWGKSVRYDSGITPACALNAAGRAVEVHQSQSDSGLWYRVGTVSNGAVAWGPSRKYDSGNAPAVAVNDSGVVVEVHKSQNDDTLWYHVGSISGDQVSWGSSQKYDKGVSASISLNNAGNVVEVHQSQNENTLWYRVGTVAGGKISFGPSRKYDEGEMPSVALTDSGEVVEVHKSQSHDTLWTRSGVVNGDSITWSESKRYDDGKSPSVSCNGKWAVQTHRSGNEATLWASPSLLLERGRWMSAHRDALASRKLPELAFPGSHDAAMYDDETWTLENYVQTQDIDLHGQLDYGSRYFDLRPYWGLEAIYLHHGGIPGPKLEEVLDDVKRFMEEGSGELVILKLSHFFGIFTDNNLKALNSQIEASLGDWLFKELDGRRLVDVSMDEFLADGGTVLVVGDHDFYKAHPTPGFYAWGDDLSVYDKYSDTSTFEDMKDDQLGKFAEYDGSRDLFLLSWTLTPSDADYVLSNTAEPMYTANRGLAASLEGVAVVNQHGQRINVVYLDYVQKARAMDVCLILNGLV